MSELKIPVVAGLCELRFQFGSSVGGEDDTRPGVGFDMISDVPGVQLKDGKFWLGSGVIGRAHATQLRNELEIFLKRCEQEAASSFQKPDQ